MHKYSYNYLKTFGFKIWICQILILILNKFNILKKLNIKLKVIKNNEILKFLKQNFSDELNYYKNYKSDIEVVSNKIWVFWWQGIENAPELVKKCVQSIKLYNKDKDVIIIDKNNINEYYNIPDYMLKKIELGTMTITHLSDILRFNLLKKYGGFWIDSTIMFTDNVFNTKNFDKFYTVKFKCDDVTSISKGIWCCFFFGGINPEFYEEMSSLLNSYYKKYDLLIDYFLTDYFIKISYENNKLIKDRFDNVNYNNQKIHELQRIMYCKYDEKTYNELLKTNKIHKLSYKNIKKFDEESLYYKIILRGDNR